MNASFWITTLSVALMVLIHMPSTIECAKVEKFILFAEDKSSKYIPLDSKSFAPITLFQHLGKQHPVALDYDPVEDRVYWSDIVQGRILSAFFNATSAKTLFRCNVQTPEGLAIDYVGRNIYWTDTGTNRIEVGLLEGTGRKLLIKDGLDQPRAIVLNVRNGTMYWTDWGANPKIEQAGMDGSARRSIVTGNLVWPNGLTIDQASHRLFWVDAKLNTIEVSDLSGGNRRLLLSSSANIHPYGLAVYENVLYWTDWNTESISRFNLTSRDQQVMVDGLQRPMDIHVFDPALIFSGFHPCAQNNGPCSDLCLLKPGGNGEYRCACPTGIQLKPDGKSCDYDLFHKTTSDKFLIFADQREIYKVPLEVPETPCYPLGINTNISTPVAVDYDPVEGKIYWTDFKLKLLARAFPTGSSVEVIAHSNIVSPAGVAVDHIGRNIYWTDEVNNRIEMAKLDGSSRRSLITSNIERPRAILLDIGERKMYWSSRGVLAKIEQAKIDGSDRKPLVRYGVNWVNSLAMDYQNRLLYWCDAYLHKIERADLQGNNRAVILDLSVDSMQPFGLALFGDILYWSDWKSQSVHKYNMKASVHEVVVRGMGKPMELHIYDQSKDAVAVTCPVLLAPPNGIRHGCTGTITENYNTVCLFSCNAGFNAVGSLSRKCLINGNWSGQDFLCHAVTCVPLKIPPRALLLNGSCGYMYGSSCVFGCQSGYVKADGNVTRTCLQTGQWSGNPIYCIETSSTEERVIASSLATVVGISVSAFLTASIIVAILLICIRKREFLMRWRRYVREENGGEDNRGYEERDGNQNDPAGADELQLTEHGIRTGATVGISTSAATCGGGEDSDGRNHGVISILGSDEVPVTERHCLCIGSKVGVYWKAVLRNLSMAEIDIRNLDEDYKYCEVAEKCYQGLLKWKEKLGPQRATIKKLCQALQKVGCSEALEALQNMSHPV